MCIAFLSHHTLRISLVEQIWLAVDDEGKLTVRECYDVFFKAPEGIPVNREMGAPVLQLLAIYPHRIINSDGSVRIAFERRPGSKVTAFDAIYEDRCSFKPDVFSVQIAESPRGDASKSFFANYSGQVVVPTYCVPKGLKDSPGAMSLMTGSVDANGADDQDGLIGTILELNFADLVPGNNYVFRLVIEPIAIKGALRATNLPEPDGTEGSTYRKSLKITAPHALVRGFRELVTRTALLNDVQARDGALAMQSVLASQINTTPATLRCAILQTHRLYLLFGSEFVSIDPSTSGCMTYIGPGQFEHPLGGHRLNGMVWSGGVAQNPNDEPFQMAQDILCFMREFGADSKAKSFIATGIVCNDIGNVGLLVDALTTKRLLKALERGEYVCGAECPDTTDQIVQGACDSSIAEFLYDEGVADRFVRRDFEIKYNVFYRYASPRLRRKFWWREVRNLWGFWLAILSFLLSMISIALALRGQ
jgi:hypothetical protein